MRHARRFATSVHQSPLAAYRRAGPTLCTGYTHLFAPGDGKDRAAAAAALRAECRSGAFSGQTSGCAPGFIQANFVALPFEHAFDFLQFVLRNPRACPLLDVTTPSDPTPRLAAPNADLRTDLPLYRVYRDGKLKEEVQDISALWERGMVGFLLGCSFSWEKALADEGLTPRNVEEGRNVPMYSTSVRNARVGPFEGPLVVSMRPYPPSAIARVAEITGRYPGAHGAPLHWGDPSALGLSEEDLRTPTWGEPVAMRSGEVPVFWACGVTPQAALLEAALPFAITHAPGHMFVTDLLDHELRVPQ